LINLVNLDLNNNQLTGEISQNIGDLINLKKLRLERNQLSGEIPVEIGELTNLESFLSLDNNQLTGEIPSSIGNLTSLTNLSLYGNQLTGEIPSEICNQGDSSPSLSNNQLCPPYPDCLTEEDIGYQDTSNCEPPSLCDEGYTEIDGECYYQSDLDVLQQFIDNSIETINWDMDIDSSGVIEPLELGTQYWNNGRRLTTLRCNSSGLSGEIPSDVVNLVELTTLQLHHNLLGCKIVDDPDNPVWSNDCLEYCNNNNGCSGEIPIDISNLTNLTTLYLNNNKLSGGIPEGISNLNNLSGISLGTNQFENVDINILSSLESLTFINLENLDIMGEIPSWIWELNLYSLDLSNNQLTGEIPVEIGNLTNLTYLSLNINQLTGEIPPEIETLTNLTRLLLNNNQLTGEIPVEIGNLTNLIFLYLDNNQLTGEIPSEIGNLTSLTYLSLYNNQLTGEIPPEIGNLTNLTYLRLNENDFTGIIPESICNLDYLQWDYYYLVSFYQNKFCPPYPECIPEDNLGYQDTSECINIGDVNGDFEINILDVVTLVNIIMDDGEYTEYGDMNYDGYLNILDVVTLVNFILEP